MYVSFYAFLLCPPPLHATLAGPFPSPNCPPPIFMPQALYYHLPSNKNGLLLNKVMYVLIQFLKVKQGFIKK